MQSESESEREPGLSRPVQPVAWLPVERGKLNLISATKWGVIALNDASFVASARRRRLRLRCQLQLNLLDLHMPNDSSFNYRVESAHFSIVHRLQRCTLHVASAQLSPPTCHSPLSSSSCPTSPLLLLSLSHCLPTHAASRNFALRFALK